MSWINARQRFNDIFMQPTFMHFFFIFYSLTQIALNEIKIHAVAVKLR